MKIEQHYQSLIPGLKLNGSNPEMVKSPFREEEKASFAYYRDSQRWKDYGTGDTGDIYELYKRLHKISFIEAKKIVDGEPEINTDNIITKTEHAEYLKNTDNQLPKFLFTRWEKRKIDVEILKKFEIGCKKRYGNYKGGFYIPMQKKHGNIVLAKEIYWNGDEKKQRWIRSKNIEIDGIIGVKSNLFKKSDNIILCEGEEDFFTLYTNGYAAATGCFGAGTFKKSWADYFIKKNVIIIYDNDEPGELGARKAAEIISSSANEVRIATPFKDKSKGYDIGDWFTEHNDIERFAEIIQDAQIFIPGNKISKEQKSNKKFAEKEKLSDLFYTEKKQLLHTEVAQYVASNYKIVASEPGNRISFHLYKNGLYEKISQYELHGIMDKLLYHDYTDSQMRSIRNILASKIFVRSELFNNYPNLLNLNNCIYDLQNYRPLVQSHEYYFTYKNTYDYDPEAKCPEFDKLLNLYSLNNQDWIDCLWEMIGYCLTGTYEIQKMFWFTGSRGGNGKGTVTRIMMKLTGLNNTKPNFSPDKLGENFYKKSLIGKRLAIAGDMPGFLANIASIKELTGGDRQSTDIKFGDAVDFENTAKLVFAMNSLPVISASEAISPILRRIELLPFDYVITDYDSDIERKIENELPGIFNKAIQGLKRLRANGYFTKVQRSDKVIKTWVGEYNTFNSFIEEVIVFDSNAEIWNYDVWEAYLTYMNEIAGPGWLHDSKNIKNQNKFTEKLRSKAAELGKYFNINQKYSNHKQRACGMYKGIRIATVNDFIKKDIEVQETVEENHSLF